MNNHTIIILAYRLLVFACTAGFAAYDLRTRRVPDQALLLFCPVALAAPFLTCMQADALTALPPALLSSLTGAAAGFLILLAAALFSKNGAGVGGGDIKLAAAMGFSYGSSCMINILLIASGLAAIASLIIARQKRNGDRQKSLSLPFVPFLAIGSLTVTLSEFI